MNNPVRVIAHVDGSYHPQRGTAGAGVVLRFPNSVMEKAIPIPMRIGRTFTTAFRAEILAVIFALELQQRPANITIYSDSQSVVNYANAPELRVNNGDLWQRFDVAAAPHVWVLEWVPGHQNIGDNDRAHMLAHRAARELAKS